jgi:hypothetical protein
MGKIKVLRGRGLTPEGAWEVRIEQYPDKPSAPGQRRKAIITSKGAIGTRLALPGSVPPRGASRAPIGVRRHANDKAPVLHSACPEVRGTG